MTMRLSAAICTAIWAVYLMYPVHQLQHLRWTVVGYAVPVSYFFTALPVAVTALAALAAKRGWSRWEILWWLLPLACLPGILRSADPVWSVRQWVSLVVRGLAVGGTLYIATPSGNGAKHVLRWIFPAVVLAALVGLAEIGFQTNPLSDAYVDRQVPETSQPDNPFYRPAWGDYSLSLRPRGTQGNRIVYAACLVPFIPISIYVAARSKRWGWAYWLAAVVILLVVVLARSRSGWAGLAVGLFLAGALMFRGPARLAVCSAVVTGGILLALWIPPWTRVPQANGEVSVRMGVTLEARLEHYRTLAALKGRWFGGVGYGQYPAVYRPHYSGPIPELPVPDNQYLRWLIENGVLGLSSLVAFLGGIVAAGWRRIRSMTDPIQADFYRALLAGWAGIATTFLFFDGFYWGASNMTFWSFLGLFATCLKPQS